MATRRTATPRKRRHSRLRSRRLHSQSERDTRSTSAPPAGMPATEPRWALPIRVKPGRSGGRPEVDPRHIPVRGGGRAVARKGVSLLEAMEARSVDEIPLGEEWQYEPKWDGFRCLMTRQANAVTMTSKSGRALKRY